jgi:predicted RNase H-like HicB family nuclease
MAQHTETGGLATVGAPSGYLVVIEAVPESYGAYVPDLPGCIAVGETAEEVTQLIREAIELHLEAMRENGDPIPPPTSTAIVVRVPAA